MARAPDPSDITPPADPAPAEAVRVLTPMFWAMMVLCLVCVLAGVLLTLFLPRLWRKPGAPAAPAAAASPAAAETPAASPALPDLGDGSPVPAALNGPALGNLDGRLRNVEGIQGRLVNAAAEALAVSTLSDAAQSSAPFSDQLASLERVLPASRDLYTLRDLAARGAPSRAALAADFDAAAAKAIVAARAPDKKDGLVAKALYALSAVVVVRRVDTNASVGPDAALARAGRLAAEGDLEGAVAATSRLPVKAQTALADWRERAQRRIDIDRRIGALREAALADLTAAQRMGA